MFLILRLPRFAAALVFCLLAGCASVPEPELEPVDWRRHREQVSALDHWALSGRLTIRQDGRAEAVNLNWRQRENAVDIRLSGTLGLGAVRVQGDNEQVIVERAGEEPLVVPGLDSLSREYLQYEFPAAYLLYWVRGIPVPALRAETGFHESGLLHTLQQRSSSGQVWYLEFDRYRQHGGHTLPGRIRLQSQGVELGFSIHDWNLDPA